MARTGLRSPAWLILLALLVPASGGTKVASVASPWAASSPVIDGLGADWGGHVLSHDPKSGAEFAFRNDGGNLYILIELDNPEAVQALRATGLKVFGRPGRSGAPGSGVLFLLRQVPTETYIGWKQRQGTILTQEEQTALRETPSHEVLLTFAVGENDSIFGPLPPASRGPAPAFGAAEREGVTSFEFRIPLASPKETMGAMAARPGEKLRVSFEWGGDPRRLLSTPASPAIQGTTSGYLSGTGRTWSQEFLDTFDTMARPTSNSKKFRFAVDVTLAEPR
jgi:hypothetical protein